MNSQQIVDAWEAALKKSKDDQDRAMDKVFEAILNDKDWRKERDLALTPAEEQIQEVKLAHGFPRTVGRRAWELMRLIEEAWQDGNMHAVREHALSLHCLDGDYGEIL